MGKIFGIISLLVGVAAILTIWFFYPFIPLILALVAIAFGVIGIIVDDSKGLGAGGLILGIITLILWVIFPLVLLTLLAGLFGGLF